MRSSTAKAAPQVNERKITMRSKEKSFPWERTKTAALIRKSGASAAKA